jgi:apolipoprotein N-acyltransferase
LQHTFIATVSLDGAPMYNSILVSDFALAGVVMAVAFAAGLPAYFILRRAKPGRARSAIAYLLGFCAGLLATVLLGAALEPSAEETPVALVGIVAAFIGPFVGMAHAKLREPVRRRPRRQASLEWSYPR